MLRLAGWCWCAWLAAQGNLAIAHVSGSSASVSRARCGDGACAAVLVLLAAFLAVCVAALVLRAAALVRPARFGGRWSDSHVVVLVRLLAGVHGSAGMLFLAAVLAFHAAGVRWSAGASRFRRPSRAAALVHH